MAKKSRKISKQTQQESPQKDIQDDQQEINTIFNNVCKELSDSENVQNQLLVSQLLDLVFHSTYSPKMVQQSFIDFFERILTCDVKDIQLKPFFHLLEKLYRKFGKLSPNNKPFKLLESLIDYLTDTFCLHNLNAVIQHRCGILLTSIFTITKTTFRLKNYKETTGIVKVVGLMLGSNKQSLQSMGVQIAGILYRVEDVMFREMMVAMGRSRYEVVRKRIIKTVRGEEIAKKFIQKRLTDSDAGVRVEAFNKMKAMGVKIEDVEDPETRMRIIKEGMQETDPLVQTACLKFLTPSIIQSQQVQISRDDLSQILSQEKPLISKNQSRRNSDIHEVETITQEIFNFSSLFKLINVKQTFINEYFVQIPSILIQTIFMALKNQEKNEKNLEEKSVQERLDNLNQQEDSQMVVAKYAKAIISKLRTLAVCSIEEPQIDRFQIQMDVISFEEILFLRSLYEYSRRYKNGHSAQFLEYLDEIVPSFDDYKQIFEFLNNLPADSQGQMFSNRLTLSEWLKFSYQLDLRDESLRNSLISMMFDYIQETQNSFQDYKYLVKNNFNLDFNGELIINDFPDFDLEMKEHDQEEQVLELDIKEFNDLGVIKDTNEYMKPFSFETFTRDSDDVCQIAVIIIKKLLGEEGSHEFTREMLQTISLVREPLEEKSYPMETTQIQPKGGSFGLHSQMPFNNFNEKVSQKLTLQEQRLKYQEKFDQKRAELEQFGEMEDFEENDLQDAIEKTKLYAAIIEEINLKEKLTLKRSMTLCLILLKQIRADVNDKNLVEICETLIQPALQANEDIDNQLLVIESIGLLGLLDEELFNQYSRIFQAILQGSLAIKDFNKLHPSDITKKQTILALKASIDGLIFYGTNQKTEQLQQIILQEYMFSADVQLRQITIEGICKMLFSHKITKNIGQFKQEFKVESEEDLEQLKIEHHYHIEGIISIISHLMIQFFDKKFNCQKSIVKQVLSLFFRNFILFSEQRCDLMLQALIRVAYSILISKYEEKPKLKKPKKPKDSDSDEEFMEPKKQRASMEEICENLEIVRISSLFMVLLSNDYINHNAPQKLFLKESFNLNYLINICNLNNTHLKKVQIVKGVICPIIDLLNPQDELNLEKLEILKEQLEKSQGMVVHGVPKLKKKIEEIQKRIEEINSLQVEGIEQKERKSGGNVVVDIKLLEEFYQNQIYQNTVNLIQDNEQGVKNPNQNDQSPNIGKSERNFNSSRQKRRGTQSVRFTPKNAILGEIIELDESYNEKQGSSSEKPQKLVRFNIEERQEIIEEEEISETSFEKSKSSKKQLTLLSKKLASRYVQSIKKEEETYSQKVVRISKSKDGRISIESSSEKKDLFSASKPKQVPQNLSKTFDQISDEDKENQNLENQSDSSEDDIFNTMETSLEKKRKLLKKKRREQNSSPIQKMRSKKLDSSFNSSTSQRAMRQKSRQERARSTQRNKK